MGWRSLVFSSAGTLLSPPLSIRFEALLSQLYVSLHFWPV